MLEAVGIDQHEERVYQTLLERGPASADALADAIGVGRERIRTLLRSLETKGLVSRTPDRAGTFTPAPPDVGLEPLVLQGQEELEQVRRASVELMRSYRDGAARRPLRQPTDVIEIVAGREATVSRFNQLQCQARHQVRVLDRPPYATADPAEVPPGSYNPTERSLLERGVRSRAIYDHRSLADPRARANIEHMIAAGEEARVLHEVPIKLAVADDQVAMVPLSADQPSLDGTVVVHASALLDGLTSLFERLWTLATPLRHSTDGNNAADEEGEPDPADYRLLSLMLGGLTDEALARQLGVGRRTVHRRVKALMDRVGADTRLQLVWQATQRGWL